MASHVIYFPFQFFPLSNDAKLAFRWGVHYVWEHHGAVIEGAAGMPVAAGEDFPLMFFYRQLEGLFCILSFE